MICFDSWRRSFHPSMKQIGDWLSKPKTSAKNAQYASNFKSVVNEMKIRHSQQFTQTPAMLLQQKDSKNKKSAKSGLTSFLFTWCTTQFNTIIYSRQFIIDKTDTIGGEGIGDIIGKIDVNMLKKNWGGVIWYNFWNMRRKRKIK